MCDFKIRAMRITEFKQVAKLVYESVHILCTNEYTKEELDAWVPPNMHMPAFKKSLSRCYAIVAIADNGELVGVMSTEKDGYVNRLYTSYKWINKGVASALLENTEQWARMRNIKSLLLESSKSAERFYIKKGFVKIGETENIKNNIRFVSAKMRKELY